MLPIKELSELSSNEIEKLCNRFGSDFSDIMINTVVPIINDIKENGDSAVKKYTQKFDNIALDSVLATQDEIDSQSKLVSEETLEAFSKAEDNIREFHSHQIRDNIKYTRNDGALFGVVFHPIESAAVYVPGGKATYPSSILMGVIPAQIAGVKNITVITPPSKDGKLSPIIAAVCKMLGVTSIIKSGGAQGIAAAAYGTETVKKADIIVGPGNIFVTAAKTYLFSLGIIQIDSMAGPSEVLVISDDKADPRWVAWDLLSQAEHEENAIAIYLTTSHSFAESVNEAIKEDIESGRGRSEIKKAALKNCHTFITGSIDEAIEFSNIYGPEHMELIVENANNYLPKIQNVGSLFLGTHSPVAIGDFFSGTNHVLPTGGAARFSSGLSVETFVRRMTYQNISPEALKSYMPFTDVIAKQEGFDDKHGDSIRIRFEKEQ